MNQEYDMKPGLGAFNRISLVVFWLRASLIGLLLLPVTHSNNWSGGYCNHITFPSNTDALCTPFRSSGSDRRRGKPMREAGLKRARKHNNKVFLCRICVFKPSRSCLTDTPERQGLVLCRLLSQA